MMSTLQLSHVDDTNAHMHMSELDAHPALGARDAHMTPDAWRGKTNA